MDVPEVLFREHQGPTSTGDVEALGRDPTSSRRSISADNPASGTMASAIPTCTTNPGMPHTTLDASSCTITRRPLRGAAEHPASRRSPSGHHDAEGVGSVRFGDGAEESGRRMGGRSSRGDPRRYGSAPALRRAPPSCGGRPARAMRRRRRRTWPSAASTTRSAEVRSRRSARTRVNIGGMCCTMQHGNREARRSSGSTVPSAVGPPVDTPIAITSMRAAGPVARRDGFGDDRWRVVPSGGAPGCSVRILGRSSSRGSSPSPRSGSRLRSA